MTDTPIQLSRPRTPRSYSQMLEECGVDHHNFFNDGRITEGPYVRAFEAKVKEITGANFAVSFPNATAGLTAALTILRHDAPETQREVIVPAFTFAATVVAILNAGCIPVFVDCDVIGGMMDEERVMDAVSMDTLAIMPVDTFGMPYHINILMSIAKDESMPGRAPIRVVVDSAQSLGATFETGLWGHQGHMHVFSFSPSKPVTAGEGGMVTTDNAELHAHLMEHKHYGFHGGSRESRTQISSPGVNGRMSEFNAVMGLWSAQQISREKARRYEIANRYNAALASCKPFNWSRWSATSSGCYYVLRLFNRDFVQQKLREVGIESKPYFWPACHRLAMFANGAPHRMGSRVPVSEYLAQECLAIPMHSSLTDDEVDRVIFTVARYANPTSC